MKTLWLLTNSFLYSLLHTERKRKELVRVTEAIPAMAKENWSERAKSTSEYLLTTKLLRRIQIISSPRAEGCPPSLLYGSETKPELFSATRADPGPMMLV